MEPGRRDNDRGHTEQRGAAGLYPLITGPAGRQEIHAPRLCQRARIHIFNGERIGNFDLQVAEVHGNIVNIDFGVHHTPARDLSRALFVQPTCNHTTKMRRYQVDNERTTSYRSLPDREGTAAQ